MDYPDGTTISFRVKHSDDGWWAHHGYMTNGVRAFDDHGPFASESGAWSKLAALFAVHPPPEVLRAAVSEEAFTAIQEGRCKWISMGEGVE